MIERGQKEQYALRYVCELGYPVIPVSKNKVPIEQGWNSGNSATDYGSVCQYWALYPNADIGILTNHQSGLAVIDVDDRSSIEPVLNLLDERCGLSSDCLVMANTARGMHLYFRNDYDNHPIRLATDMLRTAPEAIAKVDLLGNGYVVAPCSTNKTWCDGNSIFDLPLPSLPSYLIDLAGLNHPYSTTEPEKALVTHNIMGNTAPQGAGWTMKDRLSLIMQQPIPAGKSHEFYLRYGIPIFSLLDEPERKLYSWFRMRDESISEEKMKDRLSKLPAYIRSTRKQIAEGQISQTVPLYRPDQQESAGLCAEIRRLLAGSSKSELAISRTTKLTLYFISCARASRDRTFFRSYRDIIRDNPGIFGELKEESRRMTLSRLMGLVVDGYLVDKKTGEISNYVPIFKCIQHGVQYQKGEKPSGIAGEYRLSDEYRYLLDL